VHQGHLDQGCDKPIEVCFYFGANGQFFVDRDMARWVSQEEALEIHARCEAAGLVSQPDNTQKPIVMCHCCGDCCVPLKAIKKQPRPAEAVVSNYFAAVDSELCDGCETCLDRCQMEAIAIEEETAVVNTDRCIGCGLCVTTCPTEALALELKPEDMRPREPLKPHEAMMRVAQKRGKSLPTMH
jgi:Pyruvate/2-oxoacid:ferredoxin oxidoreductase delta subunit